jgi:hypothetical protein
MPIVGSFLKGCMYGALCCSVLLAANVKLVAADDDSSSSAAFEDGLDDWIMTNLEQPTLRRARVSALTGAALPFQYDLCDVLLTIGTSLSTSVK